MRLRGTLVVAALAVGTIFAARAALSQEAKPEGGAPAAAPAQETPPKKPAFKGADPREHDPAEMEKAWMEAMTPNQYHERLAGKIGEYDVDVTMWMQPGAKPMQSKGSAKVSWLFPGGKWTKEEFQGTMMGMPFQGLLIEGYDNLRKKYVVNWVDNLSTGFSPSEGNYDADGKTLVLWGKMSEPGTGEVDKTVKYVVREISADETNFQIWDMGAGDGWKVMEMTYRRKK